MDVTAQATRTRGWWAITVTEVPGAFSQARRLDQVPGMVRETVSLLTGADAGDVVVTVVPHTQHDDEIAAALAARREADIAASIASQRMRAAVRALTVEESLTVRDAGRLLQLSPQRVSQLAQ